ncbi:Chloride channel protein 2 [Eumeta japonica]|uniref:Chloride channel protein 2 n=1 Tax=Eumeta variegata TaxID=151549 RepID=A0A4C1SV03_EUMVA|nr:Chloride channel protein 2 [Eumeta japonica]
MYGRYQRDLSEAAREEARRLRRLRKRRRKDDKLRQLELEAGKRRPRGKFFKVLGYIWRNTFARLGEDWVFLALLGFIMAILNFAMDRGIAICNNVNEASGNPIPSIAPHFLPSAYIPLHQPIPPSIKYPIPIQGTSKMLVTPLELELPLDSLVARLLVCPSKLL